MFCNSRSRRFSSDRMPLVLFHSGVKSAHCFTNVRGITITALDAVHNVFPSFRRDVVLRGMTNGPSPWSRSVSHLDLQRAKDIGDGLT